MSDKRIQKIASQIIDLERECQLGENVQSNVTKMEIIMSNLSLEDMSLINDYIQKNLIDNNQNF